MLLRRNEAAQRLRILCRVAASMNESGFWGKVRPMVRDLGMFQRIENGLGAGLPDVFYLVKETGGRSASYGWIENKYRDAVPRDTTAPFPGGDSNKGLGKEQIVWWTEYLRAGGHGLLCWGVGPWMFAEVMDGELLRSFNGMLWGDMCRRFDTSDSNPEFSTRLRTLL